MLPKSFNAWWDSSPCKETRRVPPAAGQPSLFHRRPNQGAAYRPRDWLVSAVLVVAVFLVYQPAWHGQLLWDGNMRVVE